MTRAEESPSGRRTTWSGTYTYRAARLHRPRSVDELAAVITSTRRVRPLGTRHAFNDAADTDGDQISTAALPARVEIDAAAMTAAVGAGLTYAEIGPALHSAGFALPALASLPHVSVGGACATGTHGSGRRIGNLASQVSAVEFVDGTGTLRRLTRADDPGRFPGAVISVGGFGVATAITLDLVPAFDVAQRVFLDLPAEAWIERFGQIGGAAYSVSCFTRWIDRLDQLWIKQQAGAVHQADPDPALLAGSRPAAADVHPVPGGNPEYCTPQRGIAGPWHERLPHFAAGRTPSFGDEIQSEFFVGAERASDVARALFRIGPRIAPALRISEVRTVAADDLWLSPARDRDVVSFHFTWTSDQAVVFPALDLVERTLEPFAPVPHWGKVFSARTGPHGREDPRFPMLGAFAELAAAYDPDRRFVNDYLSRWHLR